MQGITSEESWAVSFIPRAVAKFDRNIRGIANLREVTMRKVQPIVVVSG
jgi:hypothetical protein